MHWTQNPKWKELKDKVTAARKKKFEESLGTEKYFKRYEHAGKRWVKDGNPNWNGGIASKKLGYDRLTKASWRRTRQEILKKYINCQKCDSDKDLIVHHIIDWDISHDNSEKNLTILCRSCHMKEHHEYINSKRGPMKAWNKGIPQTPEQRKKNSECHMGLPSPKKGQKGLQVAWNKGLTKKDYPIK